jgi:hypothetical protein
MITLVHRKNNELYPHDTRGDHPYEERFLLPICCKLFPKLFEDVKLEYDCMLEDSEFIDRYRSPYSEKFSVNLAATASPNKGTSPGRTSRTSRWAAAPPNRENETQDHGNTQQPEDAMKETDPKTASMKPAARRVAPVFKAQTTKPTAPANPNHPEVLRELFRKLQRKYNMKSEVVSMLKSKVQQWDSYAAQVTTRGPS